MTTVSFDRKVSRTPLWLLTKNPLANYPWSSHPEANLPDECEVVVIGAGFTGAGCAYFWSKQKAKSMAVLEMDDPASGSSGRNGGEIVMGDRRAFGAACRTGGVNQGGSCVALGGMHGELGRLGFDIGGDFFEVVPEDELTEGARRI